MADSDVRRRILVADDALYEHIQARGADLGISPMSYVALALSVLELYPLPVLMMMLNGGIDLVVASDD